uniref:efflux transporter outer membrane subunit n=1 Tax=Dyella silvatica TaxID=2992128 RepID=UPI0022571894
ALPTVTAAATGQGGGAQHLVEGMDIPGQWWTLFHSEPLNALIEDALKHNPDTEAAQAALRAAWEGVYVQRAAYMPSVSLGYNPSRQRVAKPLASPINSGKNLYSVATAQVNVSYTADLWGGNRRQVESLVAQADSQRFQLEAAYLTLTANLVNAAIGEAALRAQIDATQRIIASQETILRSLQRQQVLGQAADADVAAQVALLEQNRAALPGLEQQLAQQRDALAALCGRLPDERIDAQFELKDLQLPLELPLSLPAALVEQRPDVRTADAQLHAASAQIGVAIANRLPNLQITAALGSSGVTSSMGEPGNLQQTSKLFQGGSAFWTLGANLVQPLLDGGALKHKQRAAEATFEMSAAQYRSTVVSAVQDVADTLHAIQGDAATLAATAKAERAAARSLEIVQRQLALGDVSEIVSLNAQVTYQQALIALVQAQASRYSDTAALFQALGGGWWNRSDIEDKAIAQKTPSK